MTGRKQIRGGTRWAHWLPVLLPALLLLTIFGVAGIRGPSHLADNVDPEYHYLLNAAMLADFGVPATVQHPGVTVAVLGAVVIWSGWLLTGFAVGWEASLIARVIEHHGAYVAAIAWIQVLAIVALCYLAGKRVWRLTGSLWPALALQASPFLGWIALEYSYRVSPEPPQILLAFALIYLLAPVTLGQDGDREARNPSRAVWLGVLLALGGATKFNFLVLSPLILVLGGWRQWLRASVSLAVALGVLLTPVWLHYDHFASFLRGNLSEAGGASGAESLLERWAGPLGKAFSQVPAVSWAVPLCLLGGLLGIVGLDRKTRPNWSRITWVLWIGAAILVVHVVSNAMRVRTHYFVTGLAVVYFLVPHLVHLLVSAPLRRWARGVLAVAVVAVCWMSLEHSHAQSRYWRGYFTRQQERAAALAQKRAELDGCLEIGYYRSSLPLFGLEFGNSFSGRRFAAELMEIYPNQMWFKPMRADFHDWTGKSVRDTLEGFVRNGGCALVQGDVAQEHSFAGWQLHPILVPEDGGRRTEGLYRLSLDSSEPALIDGDQPFARAEVVEAENLSAGTVVTETQGGATVVHALAETFAEYTYEAQQEGRYAIRVRCASAEPRPIQLHINGELAADPVCHVPTGDTGPEHLRWHDLGAHALQEGTNKLRLASNGLFPSVDKIALRLLR